MGVMTCSQSGRNGTCRSNSMLCWRGPSKTKALNRGERRCAQAGPNAVTGPSLPSVMIRVGRARPSAAGTKR